MSLIDYTPGNIIQSNCQPFIRITKKSGGNRNICENCFKTSLSLQSCTGCRLVSYCSTKCQIKDWKNGHMIECKSKTFCNNFNKKETVDFRCQLFRAMAFLLMNPAMAQKRFDLYNGHSRCFDDLMSNQEFFENNPLKAICDEIGSEIQEENLNSGENFLDSNYFLKLAGIFQTNAFTIYNEDETEELGSGIYIQASIFDHSCKPSAVFTSKGSGIEIRAIAPIRKGEEPYISYISFHGGKAERQRYLMERYNFQCNCERCESNSEVAIDFEKLNTCINGLTELTQGNISRTSQDILLEIHFDIIRTMSELYHEYDDRVTNQYSRTLFALISSRKFLWTPKMKQFVQDARQHIKISSGIDHPEYWKFERAIAVNS